MLDAFKKYQAQTTEHPLGLIIKKAKGSYIFDDKGNAIDPKGTLKITIGNASPMERSYELGASLSSAQLNIL